jgi:RNA polymerase sigma-70 factor, ECF subfamily
MAWARGVHPSEIEALYRSRFRVFVLSATAMLADGEEALEVVQEGFARALRQRGSFRGDGTLEGWVWRIVLNVAHDRLRGARHAPSPDFSELSLDGFETSDESFRKRLLDLESLRERLLDLPERQRLAIFLRYYADLSYEQIAEALGVRPGTVAASLHAALASMRRDLEEANT